MREIAMNERQKTGDTSMNERPSGPEPKSMYMTLDEVARETQIPAKTIYEWLREGRVTRFCAVKMGRNWRFKRAFIEKHGVEVLPPKRKSSAA